MTKTEYNNIKLLLEHAKTDLSYEGEGTYTQIDKDGERVADLKNIRKAMEAINDIDWILKISTISK